MIIDPGWDGPEDDNTVAEELKVENAELNDNKKEVELSQSTQARLTELETESSSVVTTEDPGPTVATETAPPTEVTSATSKVPAATTPTVTGEKPAKDKSEEAQEKAADEPRGTVAKHVNPTVTEPSDAAAVIKPNPLEKIHLPLKLQLNLSVNLRRLKPAKHWNQKEEELL